MEYLIVKLYYLIGIFLYVYIVLYYRFNAAFKKKETKINTNNSISIIIALKNESKNIQRLMRYLNSLDYPKEKFEIIFVNDNSTDDTKEKISGAISGETNNKIIDAKNKLFEGKKGALDIGIKNSSFPFILITDADCRPPANWLKHYSAKFDDGFQFIIGVSPFNQTNSAANKISCFENMRSIFLSFALAQEGNPYNAAARNIGFTKEAFNKIGGYKNTTQTVSGDDDLLLKEMAKNKQKIGLLTNSESFVLSDTEENLFKLFHQRGRHTTTSFHYSLYVKFVLSFWHLINICFLFSPLLMWYNINFIYPFIIKIFIDAFAVDSIQKKLNYNFNLFQTIYLQMCYEFLLIISFFRGLFFSNKWK